MSESIQTEVEAVVNRILEIGPGTTSALDPPGRIFDSDTQYACIEPDVAIARSSKAGLPRRDSHVLLAADSAMLPFKPRAFSHIIMRSVVGEYTMEPSDTGSSMQNTRLGLYRSFEMLRVGGIIAMAEENTPEGPASITQTSFTLYDAGFTDITVYPCQDMKNTDWLEARTEYWGIRPEASGTLTWRYGEPIDKRWGYLLTARKPDIPTLEFEGNIVYKSLWRKQMENSTSDNDEACYGLATFIRGNRGEGIKDNNKWRESVKVITKNATFTLAELSEYQKASGLRLFL